MELLTYIKQVILLKLWFWFFSCCLCGLLLDSPSRKVFFYGCHTCASIEQMTKQKLNMQLLDLFLVISDIENV